MKKVLKNIKDLIFRHKILSLICLVAFVIVIILLYMFCSIFVGGQDKYGHRLDGIKEVEISKKELTTLETNLEKKDEIEKASVRLQGKIIYFDITFKKDINQDKAKEIASSTLEEFSKKELEYYDYEYILNQNTDNDEDTGFKITGTKSPKIDKISWIKS